MARLVGRLEEARRAADAMKGDHQAHMALGFVTGNQSADDYEGMTTHVLPL